MLIMCDVKYDIGAEAIDKTTQRNILPTRRSLIELKQVILVMIFNMSLCD